MIRNCTSGDAGPICDIYNHYIRETVVTFEEVPVPVEDMARRITDVTAHLPWIVWEADGVLVGYAYAAPWKSRSAYRFSVESSIYLAPHATGQGIGTRLYAALLADLRNRGGVHCIIGGCALPNPGSVALHEAFGFTWIGQFREIGRKHGRWVDVAYWQLIL